jgi:2-polyprenyl-6-methoxyphenol hydroxylase-like FAD-dependent oxidoreductase
MARPQAIVVGAGPGGLATALALRHAGVEATVYERRHELDEIGSGLTLWPNAMRALEAIGMAGAVRAVSAPAHGIAIRSASGRILDATGPELMRQRFEGGGAALHRADLQRVLADAVGRESIRLGAAVAAVDQDERGAVATLADGSRQRADLLVGADGIRSRVRAAALGDVPLRYAGYTVWRAVAQADTPDAAGTLTMGRGAQFGLFPMTGGRVYWFASLNVPERTAATAAGAAGRARLLASFDGWHEPIPAVIAATPPDAIVATAIHDTEPQPRRAAGRVALVGDAAHPATPALGQGACQAIEDAVVLGQTLAAGAAVPGALREYERRRVDRTNAMTRQARQMGAMGQWENRAACWLRDRMIERTPMRLRVRQLERMFSFDL